MFEALPTATSGPVVLSNVSYDMSMEYLNSYCSGPLATDVTWIYDAQTTPVIAAQASSIME